MKSFLTFDYELFFGNNPGTTEKCIIEPTNQLIHIAAKTNAKMIFFVDAGYLKTLNKFSKNYQSLRKDLDLLNHQLETLVKLGHDIQLHIHPHWEDSHYDGERWVFDTSRYKLSSFKDMEVIEICSSYKQTLNQFSDDVFAFRAGGWCIQPFDKIKTGLKENNIWLDSTIYKDGINLSENKGFDFTHSPSKEYWHFENDPLVETRYGYFLELPISSSKISPVDYWKIAFNKFFPRKKHESIGDGNSLSSGSSQTIKLLTNYTNQPVFLDGIKSNNLIRAYKNHERHTYSYFTAIGHPKAMSSYSFNNMSKLLQIKNGRFVTYTNIKEELLSI
jgi:hypothetical protein